MRWLSLFPIRHLPNSPLTVGHTVGKVPLHFNQKQRLASAEARGASRSKTSMTLWQI